MPHFNSSSLLHAGSVEYTMSLVAVDASRVKVPVKTVCFKVKKDHTKTLIAALVCCCGCGSSRNFCPAVSPTLSFQTRCGSSTCSSSESVRTRER